MATRHKWDCGGSGCRLLLESWGKSRAEQDGFCRGAGTSPSVGPRLRWWQLYNRTDPAQDHSGSKAGALGF